MKKFLSILLCMILLLTLESPAAAAETAATMRLEKTEGTVWVTSASGTEVPLREGMRLYSGYRIKTDQASYAYISLDGNKAAKLDASSSVLLAKTGRKLELQVAAGKLFFDVTQPLETSETLNIRTSTLVTGIRGTAGWIEVMGRFESILSLLEGKARTTCANLRGDSKKAVLVRAGESVRALLREDQGVRKQELVQEPLTPQQVPGFVRQELAENPTLQKRFQKAAPMLDPVALVAASQETLERKEQQAEQQNLWIQEEAAEQRSIKTEPAFPPDLPPEPTETRSDDGGSAPPEPLSPPSPAPEEPIAPPSAEPQTVTLPTPETTDLASEIQSKLQDSMVGTVQVKLPAETPLELRDLVLPSGKTLQLERTIPPDMPIEKLPPVVLRGSCRVEATGQLQAINSTVQVQGDPNDQTTLVMDGSVQGNLVASSDAVLTGGGSFLAEQGDAITLQRGGTLRLTGGTVEASAGTGIRSVGGGSVILEGTQVSASENGVS